MIDQLIKNIINKKNPTVVGLDTCLDYIPSFLIQKYVNANEFNFYGASQAIIEFNKTIIDAVCDLIPAVKIQVAYYELYGVEGIRAFYETINYAKSKDLIVIGDVKRNDIDSTARAYSSAYLGKTKLLHNEDRAFVTDCITINPYLGFDGVKPFLDDCKEYNKGVFILVKTSNPSSGDFQDLISGDKRIYEIVADKVKAWGQDLLADYGYSQVGAVVGATYPSQGIALRQRMPNTFFLVPGYGAQGGGVADIIGCFDNRGLGAVINASRSIICAYNREPWKQKYDDHGFAEAARAEVISMKNDIESGLFQNGMKPW
ncbi:MAG: orotidine-5'-phosphate decarboxylase [Firmicutes bacterium]|nr:orotidine-5'-phosphate decarboxylase [Bacillota bacterium]